MNIFILDKDITANAKAHCNSHVIKMPLELCQIMCTNMELHGLKAPMKSTHKNHPSTIWARESLENFQYTLNLCKALCIEYTHRYGKRHKVEDYLHQIIIPHLPSKGLTKFAEAMPDKYKEENPIQSYRNYYNGDKLTQSGWRWEYKNRIKPNWAV